MNQEVKILSNFKNTSTELMNKIGKYKKENDPNDELSIIECVSEMADKEDIELDYYADILSDNPSFKVILKEDMTKRGLLYMDGKRVINKEKLEEW